MERRRRLRTHLSGLTLVPLAPGRATITWAKSRRRSQARRRCWSRCRSARSRSKPRYAASPARPSIRRNCARFPAFARERGIGMHLDGARLLIEAAYTGDRAGRYGGAVRHGLCVAVEIPERGIGGDPRRPAGAARRALPRSAACSAAACRCWPYAAVALHFLDGFTERFAEAAALSRAADHRAGRASPGDGSSTGRRPPMSGLSRSPEPARRPLKQLSPPAASRSARRGGVWDGGAESALHTNRRSCAESSPRLSTLSPPRSTRSPD